MNPPLPPISEATQARIEFLKNRVAAAPAPTATPENREDPVDVAEIAELLAATIIPKDMPVTDPSVYRAHIFKTEIAPALRAFGFDRRHCQDRLLENATKGTKAAKQAWVKERVANLLRDKGAIIALPGGRGVGKTTIAAQIAIDRLWQDWHSARDLTGKIPVTCRTSSYRKLNEIVSKLKGLYADYGSIQIERMEAYRNFLTGVTMSSTGSLRVGGGADLLIIDELNEPSEDSKHKDRILTDIVDRRYSRCLDTILITNQKPEEFATSINESIYSRLKEHGDIIPCEWESFRDFAAADHHPNI